MMVVADLDDVFVPIADGLFADPAHSRYVLALRSSTIGSNALSIEQV